MNANQPYKVYQTWETWSMKKEPRNEIFSSLGFFCLISFFAVYNVFQGLPFCEVDEILTEHVNILIERAF